MAVRRSRMKFTNTYRYVVLKQVMFLILFLIILVCMIKIDLEYLKQEVRIVFAFVIYFAIKIGLFFIDRLCGVQKEKMQYHSMKAVYDEMSEDAGALNRLAQREADVFLRNQIREQDAGRNYYDKGK